MKRILALLVGVVLLMATNAMAIPTLNAGYTWVNAPFWTNTDKTTGPADGNSQFQLIFENASFESDFGLFSVTGSLENPTGINTKFKIFDYLQEPSFNTQTVLFKSDGSISLDGIHYTAFDKQFGFYFDVHTGGANDLTADYSFYSYNLFNSPASETGVDHVLTAYNSLTHEVMIYLDDQLVARGGSDRDFDDMVVYGNDLSPVPEPGTMALLGFGMLGLAIYGKRRMNRDA